MAEIIDINKEKIERKRYIFKSDPVRISVKNEKPVMYPCIGLYDKETGIGLTYPGFERWYLELKEAKGRKSETLRKRAYHICCFLNYILWETRIDKIEKVTLDDIRDFLVDFKTTLDDEERDPGEWGRGIADVYVFLLEYQKFNQSHAFNFDSGDLYKDEKIYIKRNGRNDVLCRYNRLNVTPPKKHSKKNRFLLEGYLDIILFEATKYDTMLALGIALQAYAGLREGEVVNLTRTSIKPVYAGFGRIGRILIDLEDEAPFAKNWTGKIGFGSIKVNREAKVYTDFLTNIMEFYNRNSELLDGLNADKGDDAPLFLNEWGNPMSVHTYKGRVKKLFMEHFLPTLKLLIDSDGSWAEHAPYIEAYERDYPGAHAFRHWFTMYLIKHVSIGKNQDIIDIVADWRGDSSREAMEDYLHINADIISIYKHVVYQFQRTMLERIL